MGTGEGDAKSTWRLWQTLTCPWGPHTPPWRAHPSSDARITLSWTASPPASCGVGPAYSFPLSLEDKGATETKGRERNRGNSRLSHRPWPCKATSGMLIRFISALQRPEELLKASVANMGSSRSK